MQAVEVTVQDQSGKPLSVIFLTPILGDGWGGVEKWMLSVGLHLMRRGHRAVAAGGTGTRWLDQCRQAGLETLGLSLGADFHPASVWRLRRCIGQKRADLLCVKMPKAIRLAGTAALLLPDPRPVVICRMGDSAMQRSWRARLTYRWLGHAYITPSARTRRDLLAYGHFRPEQIDLVPNGVAVAIDKPAVRQRVRGELGVRDEKLVIVNSRLHPAKGHTYLLEAVRQLAGSIPLRLLVVGNGAHRAELENKTISMGLQGIVSFTGFRTDVGDLLQGADLAVLPSTQEGLPNTVLEAMAAAKPVVASAVDGVPEAVADGVCGILVPPADTAALARAMATLLRDEATARRMGAAGRDRVRRLFSLDSMLARTEAVFLARRERRRPDPAAPPCSGC